MVSFQSVLVSFLTGQFKYSAELQAFWMAIQGAVAVRKGPNAKKSMAWFHSFCLSVIAGYGGALFTNIWMGKPTSMLSNDLNLASCIVAYIIVNLVPFGYKVCTTVPVVLITTVFAQLFRSLGVVKFTDVAFEAFKENPSAYYPIPVFGPIMFATILGNMSGFFLKGFHEYIKYGMPWPFQNGLFCSTLYHFIAHDETGLIGSTMRTVLHSIGFLKFGLDDATFMVCFVGAFMQIVGLLQLPYFLGPGFSPFDRLLNLLDHYILRSKIEVQVEADTTSGAVNAIATKKKRRNRRKKKDNTAQTNGPVTTYTDKKEL